MCRALGDYFFSFPNGDDRRSIMKENCKAMLSTSTTFTFPPYTRVLRRPISKPRKKKLKNYKRIRCPC